MVRPCQRARRDRAVALYRTRSVRGSGSPRLVQLRLCTGDVPERAADLFALLIVGIRDDFLSQKRLALGQLLTLFALAIVIVFWISGNTLSGTAIRQWLAISASARHYAFALLIVGLVSLLFSVVALRRPLSLPLRSLLALSAMALCWLMRWTLLIQGQTLPKFNAQFTPTPCPPVPTVGLPSSAPSACGSAAYYCSRKRERTRKEIATWLI